MNYNPKPLTKLEIEYLTLLAKGLKKFEIANLYGVSEDTVVAHFKKIYRKMRVHNAAEAVYEAFITGYLKVPE